MSGSPTMWMRSVGTGTLLLCQIPQARMDPVSPRDSPPWRTSRVSGLLFCLDEVGVVVDVLTVVVDEISAVVDKRVAVVDHM